MKKKYQKVWDNFTEDMDSSERLKLLCNAIGGKRAKEKVLARRRVKFNKTKHTQWPMENITCFVCFGKANARHHVIPLSRGGKNSPYNIVPICHSCHARVHPWLQ